MLPTIENSDRFKNEYNSFRDRISKITNNDRLKGDLSDKLNKLLKEVRALDRQHLDVLMSKQLPNIVADSRTTLTELRQSIDKALTSYEQTHKN